MHYQVCCRDCEKPCNLESDAYRCSYCGGRLVSDYVLALHKTNPRTWIDKEKPGIWQFWRLLPVTDIANAVSLGEGGTFLHACNALSDTVGVSKLWIKNEGTNPTGSFKDRNAAVAVSKALELGASSLAVASDGNVGPSVAAYAAAAGLPCFVFMPTATAPSRMHQVVRFGAQLVITTGDGLVNDSIALVERLRKPLSWHHLSTATPVNPYQIAGPKTIVYELVNDLRGEVPDWIACPVGGAGLLVAISTAFQEMRSMGLINRIPKLLGVQASACAPVVRAYEHKEPVEHWKNPLATQAFPICVPFPLDGDDAIAEITRTNGVALSVSEEQIAAAQELAAKEAGICASSAGAAALAGLQQATQRGLIRTNETAVVIVTGSGMKDLGSQGMSPHTSTINVSIDDSTDELIKRFCKEANPDSSDHITQ